MHVLLADDTWQSMFKDSKSNCKDLTQKHRQAWYPAALTFGREEAFWCGRQNKAVCVCVFFCLSVAANLSRAVSLSFSSLSLSASHCMSVFVLLSFIISLHSLFFLLLVLPTSVFLSCMFLYAGYRPLCVCVCRGYLCIALLFAVSGAAIHRPPLTSLSEGYQSKAWCVSHWARRHRSAPHRLSSVPAPKAQTHIIYVPLYHIYFQIPLSPTCNPKF